MMKEWHKMIHTNLNKALTGKSGLFCIRHIVLCFLLTACIPLLTEAQNVGLVGVEDVQQTWLDDGTHVVFSHVNNELTFFDRQGQKIAAFRPDEPVSSISSVYSDGKRIHVLAAAEAGRSVIALENGLFSVITLPEERIKGLVYAASGGAYYRTEEDRIGYFDFQSGRETTYGDIRIGGLYALASEYGNDVLYVSDQQTKEYVFICIQNDRVLWQFRLSDSDSGSMRLPGAMKLTAPGTLLAAVSDLKDGSGNELYYLSDGRLLWHAPVFNTGSFCTVDKIILSQDDKIHLIGTNGGLVRHAAYTINGEFAYESVIEETCPFNLFTYENGKIYGLDQTGGQRIVLFDSL